MGNVVVRQAGGDDGVRGQPCGGDAPMVQGRCCFCRGVLGVQGTMKFSFPSPPSSMLRSRRSLDLSRGVCRTLRCREWDLECDSSGVLWVARHERLRRFSVRGTCTVVPFNSAAVYARSDDMFSLRSNDGTCCNKTNICWRLVSHNSRLIMPCNVQQCTS